MEIHFEGRVTLLVLLFSRGPTSKFTGTLLIQTPRAGFLWHRRLPKLADSFLLNIKVAFHSPFQGYLSVHKKMHIHIHYMYIIYIYTCIHTYRYATSLPILMSWKQFFNNGWSVDPPLGPPNYMTSHKKNIFCHLSSSILQALHLQSLQYFGWRKISEIWVNVESSFSEIHIRKYIYIPKKRDV